MITVTKFAANSGTPEAGCRDFGGALLPVPGVDRGPGEELDDAMLHKSVWQQLTEQFGADIFICTQAAK